MKHILIYFDKCPHACCICKKKFTQRGYLKISDITRKSRLGGLKPKHMASVEQEPITGVLSPQWGPGAEPLVGGLRGQSPPEAESFFAAYAFIL